ncbi:hypothetical protein OPV22_010834 [Ensete ventricosum]|uniref:Uncharacterized protein n=1 Tax=Ensete ventricosum TaxID=4639 RepID=A0A426WW50_ENSVE|nr:hypothetical protein OPV22_010834 [Ensete ventricosum]RRT31431.1 hypothetical protein B296_00058009 [Ensete ventricosum]
MGRGKGKGKKSTLATSNEDHQGSGDEEAIPAYKRRGRPQRPLKDDVDEDVTGKIEDGEDDVKLTASPSKDPKVSTVVNRKKRKRQGEAKDNPDLIPEENLGAASKSKNDDVTGSNGFRHTGSRRRKSKPRRAAGAGVECK